MLVEKGLESRESLVRLFVDFLRETNKSTLKEDLMQDIVCMWKKTK